MTTDRPARPLATTLASLALFALVLPGNGCILQDSESSSGGGSGGDTGGLPGSVEKNSPASQAEWNALKAKALGEVSVAQGWSKPQLVPGQVNSIGWEDSANISPDGQRLTFAYIPGDFHGWVAGDGGRVDRFEKHGRGPIRGMKVPFAIDTFVSTRQGDSWGTPVLSPFSVNADPIWQAETGMMEADGAMWYSANHPAGESDYDTDIWMDGQRLPFNTDKDENDPHYVDGQILFWSDNIPGGIGGKDIWVSRRNGTSWSKPETLPAPINDRNSNSWQPFLNSSGTLLFTSNRDGPETIWTSQGQGDNWSQPSKLVWPKGGGSVIAVAEPTMTADGKQLYFCVMFANAKGEFDLDIAFTRKTGG